MITNDPCFRSLELLNSHITNYLGSKIHLPDLPESINPKEEYEHVVLTGLFYQRIFQIEYWPENNFYLYCLSPIVKRILIEIFEFDQNVIRTIPRYKLFAKKDFTFPLKIDSKTKIFTAGRLSPQKNIEFLIFLCFYLQIYVSPNIELSLIGNFDNEHHREQIHITTIEYELKILKLIKSLPWLGHKPQIIKNLDSHTWLNILTPNHVFISSSTLISEDFSVSVAQIQNTFPVACIVPNWGAFHDLEGSNLVHYDSELIADTYQPLNIISKKAKEFAKKLTSSQLSKNPSILPFLQTEIDHQLINKNYLNIIFEKNKSKWGEDIEFIAKGDFHQFVKSENGQLLFKKYKEIFSSKF